MPIFRVALRACGCVAGFVPQEVSGELLERFTEIMTAEGYSIRSWSEGQIRRCIKDSAGCDHEIIRPY